MSELVFVLTGTTHTGNIGAAARAIKTMGFSALRLVDACPHRTDEAKARASGADDVLLGARRFETLAEAVADCQRVYGTSARVRHLSQPLLTPRAAADDARAALSDAGGVERAAVVFGRERSGLSNDELDRCDRLIRIPCNPEFSSLNLGSAVQVLAYEFAQALGSVDGLAVAAVSPGEPPVEDAPADGAALERFHHHLADVMVATGFLDPDNPRQLQRRLRQYFSRNRPSVTELNILRGILTSVQQPHPPGAGLQNAEKQPKS